MSPTPSPADTIARNWQRVQQEVAEACHRAGRDPGDVTIVGVTKYVEPSWAGLLLAAGCHDLGENRPQELWRKAEWFSEHLASLDSQGSPSLPRWHLIGHLQRNKITRTLPLIHLLHSLDSLRLAYGLDSAAERLQMQVPLLLEVNISRDATKTGIPAAQIEPVVDFLRDRPRLQLLGLMAMATHGAQGEEARREFAEVRALRDRLSRKYELPLPHLSMGMSGDFAEAIAEGATIVRIGSLLWHGTDAMR
ncbi:MAG: YggS family pyridoxal phosphate-dependent enzyme [Planctomycetota bacterium]|nr:MAG: YggS family pyridoxal phosphate-dependent enzyme [Planctomycetota bacterium]